MKKSLPAVSETELAIMKVLWRLKKGTVADVRTAMTEQSGKELAYTTVMTMLGRLEAKGAVRADKAREPYLYRPTFKEATTLRDRLRQFVDTVFDGRVEDVVCQLLDSGELSDEELNRIEETLRTRATRERRATRPATNATKVRPS